MFKRKMKIFACLTCFAMISASGAYAQKRKKGKEQPPVAAPAKSDTAKKTPPPPKVKKYSEVITKEMRSQKGYLTVHSKDDKFFFEVPFSLFGKDILTVNRIAKASADMRNGVAGYNGDQIGESVYQFERGPGDKIWLRRISFSEYTKDSTADMFMAVQNNNVQAIAASFPVAAYNQDSTAAVIDVSEFLNSDNNVTYFENQKVKDRAGMGAQQADRSYVKSVSAYPTNLEIRAFKTYTAGLNPTSPNYSVELSSSMVLLPEKPMQPRIWEQRVGYFSVGHRDFDVHPQSVEITRYAKRWRLEPKSEDEQRYLRGELVEPKKQIVFYIDPATPKKWIPYLIAGVNDWNKAFEKAGWKNAIVGKEAPTKEQDSTWSLDDARHSAIIYRPSAIPNAMGPSVADPRSGEIIESHIFWYHNVMQLLQKWYLVQCAAVDPRARKPIFDDELMGDLIRFVSSHEVGHTLGLLHNFGSSHTTPVEKLRDKEWVEQHGHTPSIMDYARFNYVAQPEDNIGKEGLYPRINDYDKWAIEWGYRWRPEFKNEWDEQKALAKIVTDSLKKNPRLIFGGEMEPFDPRDQNEDLGDDNMKASDYGIKNLKRILPQIIDWTKNDHQDNTELLETFKSVFSQYGMYLGHVLKNIGGQYNNYILSNDPRPVYVPVEYDKQKRAMKFLSEHLFTTPQWLNNKKIFEKIPYSFGMEFGNMQLDAINALIGRRRMSQLMNAKYESNVKAYTLEEMFDDLNKSIFAEIYAGKNVDFYRRNLQKIYVYRLMEQAFWKDEANVLAPGSYQPFFSDMQGVMRFALKEQMSLLKKAAANPGLDKMNRIHAQELHDKIKKAFEAK